MFYYRGVFFLFHAHRDFRPIECAATAHVASLGIGVNQWQGSSKDDEAKDSRERKIPQIKIAWVSCPCDILPLNTQQLSIPCIANCHSTEVAATTRLSSDEPKQLKNDRSISLDRAEDYCVATAHNNGNQTIESISLVLNKGCLLPVIGRYACKIFGVLVPVSNKKTCSPREARMGKKERKKEICPRTVLLPVSKRLDVKKNSTS